MQRYCVGNMPRLIIRISLFKGWVHDGDFSNSEYPACQGRDAPKHPIILSPGGIFQY